MPVGSEKSVLAELDGDVTVVRRDPALLPYSVSDFANLFFDFFYGHFVEIF